MAMPINVTSTSSNMDTLSRNELINYVNETLDLRYKKVEEMSSGAAYCQMLHRLWPEKVPVKKIKFNAKLEHAFIENWRVLQDAFKRLHIAKEMPVEKLVKGRFQDNFEFLQWFYKFYTINDGGNSDEYDPAAIRGNAGAPTGTKCPAKRPPVKKPAAPAAAAVSTVKKSGSGTNANIEVKRLTKEVSDLVLTVEGLEKERDFYFSKLKDIEVICQEKEGDEEYTEFVAHIIEVLYATEEGFGAAEEVLEGEGEEEEEEY